MALKCKSHIMRTYARAKADACLPHFKDIAKYPEVCGGAVTVEVGIDHGYGCSCCNSPEIEVTLTCKRCKLASLGMPEIRSYELAELATEALAARQAKEEK